MNKQATYAFTGVFIPANIWNNTQMSWLDKTIWAIVAHLHDGSSICVATDAELADMLNENEMLITASVNKLIGLSAINQSIDADGRRQLWKSGVEFVIRESQTEEDKNASIADVRRIVDLYNECCKALPRAEKLTPPRVARIRKLLKENDEAWFKFLFMRVQASDFLTARSGGWTGASIDWVLAPSNLIKITEGNYDNRVVVASRPLPENLRE